MKEQIARTQQKVVGRRQSPRVKAALPLLPMRGIVVFPYMVLPLPIGRDVSIRAVERALAADRRLLLVAQQQTAVEEPLPEDLYSIGTIATVLRWVTLPNGHLEILVQGQSKVRIQHYTQRRPYLQADFQTVNDIRKRSGAPSEVEALIRDTREKLERLFSMGYLMPPDILILAENVRAPGRLADAILSNLELEVDEAQSLLEQRDPLQRLSAVGNLLENAFERMVMQHHIRSKAQENLTKTQREYFLREQLRTIQQELGEGDEHPEVVLELKSRIDEANMPPEVEEEGRKQLGRLERMPMESSEANLIHTYVEWLLELPWRAATEDCLDLHRASEVLNADHYGLERVKERILEFLGIRKLKPQMPGPILCFVGAPGVGKTSLGSSIARALGRKFVRLSLGGVRDEAEIRGHRRTYVGAMPGRIAQNLRKAGVINPVFLLDEVDKMGRDGHGDPAAALLEVLDAEQNHAFNDHYLGVPLDLSQVMFIATANVADAIPSALRDRFELIYLDGYNDDEKLQIALRHLIPKQMDMHGVERGQLRLSEATLKQIITGYTREAGVRQLERSMAAICRKIARQLAEGQTDKTFHVHRGNLSRYLGVQIYLPMLEQQQDEIGVALGLAWSERGGEVIHVEATVMPGKGQLVLTGQLGEVMQESARAALSYMRTHANTLAIDPEMFSRHDLHIHVPAGAIPKDGPSAGVTMAAALLSALTARPLLHTVAMTGEITLRGQVLAVGGIKEKVLAAERVGLTHVILPKRNQKDLEDIPAKTRHRMHFIFAHTVADVFDAALTESV
jgi:ATP-dependent Lon protease